MLGFLIRAVLWGIVLFLCVRDKLKGKRGALNAPPRTKL